eukprot:scaffold9852_cov112-Isochrysis_galbana.AAC.2
MLNRLGGAGGPLYLGLLEAAALFERRPAIGSPHRCTIRLETSRSVLSSYWASGLAPHSRSYSYCSFLLRCCTRPEPHRGAGAGALVPGCCCRSSSLSISSLRPCLSRRTVSAPAPKAAASSCSICRDWWACISSTSDETAVCSPGAQKDARGAAEMTLPGSLSSRGGSR